MIKLSKTNRFNAMKTTRETSSQIIHNDTANNLQNLLQINYDAQEGFKQVMLKSESKPLTDYLKKRAALHSSFATAITDTLVQLNETPKESGTFAGKVHRAWIDVKAAITSNDPLSLLEECKRGEQVSVAAYKNALDDTLIELEINTLLKAQLEKVSSTLNEVKTLGDTWPQTH